MATSYYDNFIKKLEEIFMMDHAELDFGIYRIMNQKRADIVQFLEYDLLPQVKAILNENNAGAAELQSELEQAVQACHAVGVNPDESPKVKDIKQKMAACADVTELENNVYSHLTTFFSRYYDEGDFVSKRRYKDNTYAIPYNGEEVKLHWANSDQYYIKTSEYFQNYTFKCGERKVHFVLKDANTEQNNNKAQNNMERRFALYSADDASSIEIIDGELNIYFTYDLMPKATKQKDLCAKALESLKVDLPAEWSELFNDVSSSDKRSLLEKHLTDYTAKNSFDYFIHKDLGGFLRRELDFYIKNEVLHIDDLDANHINSQISQVKAIKGVGEKIICFLSSLEDFQKKLWLKKKFVVQCDYCITIDRVPGELYADICANERQREEWVRLFAIDEIKGDMMTEAYSAPLTEEFLRQNPFLVLDTAFFSPQFKHKLVSHLGDKGIDENCNGLLVNSDNIHFIRFISEKYSNTINCIHIDPPYNTDTSGFLYKNNYRHSSWLSMMDERITMSKTLLDGAASFICHIDENEYENLFNLFKRSNLLNLGTVIWDKRNPMTGGGGIALQHEYMTWFSPSEVTISTNTATGQMMLDKVKELISKYGLVTDELKSEYRKWLNATPEITGGDAAYNNVNEDGRIYQSVSLRAPEPRTDPKFHQPLIHPITGKPCPMPANGFSRTPETLAGMIERGDIIFGEDETTQPRYKMYLSSDTKKQLTSVIANAVKGKTELTKLGFDFPYCHSTTFYNTILSSCIHSNDIVADYFAGSGTTGHTIIDYNRSNEGSNIRYFLCETNYYFNTITRPRIQKVIYSPDWKDGKPVSRQGISQCFKYLRLEQYEDTLNNLIVNKTADIFSSAEDNNFKETYMLGYMMDTETKGSLFNLDWFVNPFAMTIKTTKDNELVETNVDMVETFNFLIGLNVETIHWHHDDCICVVEGMTHRDNDKALVIWRDCNKIDNETLNRFFEKMDYSTRGNEFDIIYVNGDNTLPNLRRSDDRWKVVLIEEEFQKRMFEEN